MLSENKVPLAGVAWFATENSQSAHNQLLEDHLVDALEWTVDSLLFSELPKYDARVLELFASQRALVGHGVHYSVLSAHRDRKRPTWLKNLKNDPLLAHYKHFSVHFGFSTGWELDDGAPLPVPFTDEALAVGHKNLGLLADIVPTRIGLENLALAFSLQDVQEQGEFLDALLKPFDGFLLLDLHNLYCQAINFEIPLMTLIRTYPLERVHEIHISGGSWSERKDGRRIRRDTHDHAVPEDILEILNDVITLCPNLDFVFLEQLPSALKTQQQRNQFVHDYKKMLNHLNKEVPCVS